jgi:hypothetical protein
LQCANGYRLLNIVDKLGAQETNIESFITQIYTLCTSKNISPELIVQVSAQLAALDETIPVSQIPEYIHQKIEEKQHLERGKKTERNKSECTE